jgi:hypothetical protein
MREKLKAGGAPVGELIDDFLASALKTAGILLRDFRGRRERTQAGTKPRRRVRVGAESQAKA